MFDLRDFAARTHFVILSEVSSANAVEESRTASRLAARVSALAGTKPVPVSLLAERSILSSDSAPDSVGFFEAKPVRPLTTSDNSVVERFHRAHPNTTFMSKLEERGFTIRFGRV